VNVDAPKLSAAQLVGLYQPLLWIRLERAGPPPAEFLKTASSSVYELRIAGAKHSSVEDWDYRIIWKPNLRFNETLLPSCSS